MEVLFPLQPRREGNRLYKTSNYLSLSFRKTCNAALGQKAFSLSYSMGYCAVSLQLLVILEKCWLEGGRFAFDNWHLLLETNTGVNSPSLGKGEVCEKTQAKLCLSGRDELISFPWHPVKLQPLKLCHNTPALLPPEVRREQLQWLLWHLSCHRLHWFALVLSLLWAHFSSYALSHFAISWHWANEIHTPGQAGGKGMFFTESSAAGRELKSVLKFLMFCWLASSFHRTEASYSSCMKLFKNNTPNLTHAVGLVVFYLFLWSKVRGLIRSKPCHSASAVWCISIYCDTGQQTLVLWALFCYKWNQLQVWLVWVKLGVALIP